MYAALASCVIAAILLTTLYNLRLGIVALIPAIMLSPVVTIGGTNLRIEHVLTAVLLLLVCLQVPDLRCPLELLPLGAWLVCIALGSVLTAAPFEWQGYYGMLRPVLLFWLAYNVHWKREDFWKGAAIFVATGIPIACLCVAQILQNPHALDLTFKAYTAVNQTALDREVDALSEGYIVVRSVGVLGNVAPNGLYFSAVTLLSLFLLSVEAVPFGAHRGRWRWIVWLAFLSGIVGGCAAMSGTYFATTLVSLALFCVMHRKLWSTIRAFVFMLTGLGILAALIDLDVLLGFFEQMVYQWDRIAGLDTTSRYGSQSILSELATNIQGHLVFGFGSTRQDIFIGDSLYAVLIAFGGIVGMLCFLVGIVVVMARARRARTVGSALIVLTYVLLVGGVSANGMLVARLGDCWWLLAAMCCRLAAAETCAERTASRKMAAVGLLRMEGANA